MKIYSQWVLKYVMEVIMITSILSTCYFLRFFASYVDFYYFGYLLICIWIKVFS